MIKEILDKISNNKYTSTVLTLFLVLYGGLAGPKLPKVVKNLFKESIFRIVFLALIVYSGNRDVKLSIILGVVFVIGMHHLSNLETEQFTSNDCYNNCMKDTIGYLNKSNHDKEIKNVENWFTKNRALIKEFTPKLNINKIWVKDSKHMDTKNIYNTNTLHQEIQEKINDEKNNIISKHGAKKFSEISKMLKKGKKLFNDTITSYTMIKTCNNECK